MFGYITIAADGLTQEQQDRYRAHYCGLCHTLGERFGAIGRMTLSYDMTFLYLLLSSLYEPETNEGTARCLPHPVRPHAYVRSTIAEYCCDLNIALAYHKCMDDWQDDHNPAGRAEAALLRSSYLRVQQKYPDQCAAIEQGLKKLNRLEKSGEEKLDEAANLFAEILGRLYRYQEDLWADTLSQIGQGMGRFIYLMDAYDDLEKDVKRKRYNPLRTLSRSETYEELIQESLMMFMGECTHAFETLPLVQHLDILRNILYSGCWTRYRLKQQKREKGSAVAPREEPQSKADAHKEDGA